MSAGGRGVHGGGPVRVLLPRPAGRAGSLPHRLLTAGVIVEHHPLVEMECEAGPAVQEALRGLAAGEFTDLVVTSRSAVTALLAATGLSPERSASGRLHVHPDTRVVAVGARTAAALRDAGVEVAQVAGGSGAALVAEMPAPEGRRTVLFPASAAAAATVPDGLAAAGYTVRRVEAYRPRAVDLPGPVAADLSRGAYAAIVLTSPMIARCAAASGMAASTAVVTIGGPTTAAAEAAGLDVAARAAAPDDEHLAAATLRALGLPPGPPVPGER